MNLFLEFVETIQKLGLEYYGLYYSVYQGVVTDVDDPDQRGRIKITVPSLIDEDQELDEWAIPVGRDNAGDQAGSFFPPYVGDVVDVVFENGNIDYPRYMGGFWADEEMADDFTASYPNVKGWAFRSGQRILVDESEDKLKISLINGEGGFLILDDTDGKEGVFLQHKTGSLLQITKDGNIILASNSGNLVFLNEETGEVTMKSADGSVVALSDKVVVSDSTGKSTVSMDGDTVQVSSASDVILSAPGVNIKAGNVSIGEGAEDNAVLYSKLKEIVDNHVHPTGVGPSGPAMPPYTMAITENIPPQSAKAGNVKLKGNL